MWFAHAFGHGHVYKTIKPALNCEYFFSQVDKKVKMIIGHGAYAMIYPKYRRRDQNDILDALRNGIGDKVEIYAQDEIPEHLHWCTDDSKYCPPILVLAQPGTVRIFF